MVHYAFDERGGLYKVQTSLCINPKQVIASLMESGVIYAGRIYDGIHIALVNSTGIARVAFIKEMPHIKLSTKFSVDTDTNGDLCHFIDYKGGVKASVDWVVPDGYRLFFCLDRVGHKRYGLILVDPEGDFRMIPMSNCYDDCTVCTGDMDIPDTDSIAEEFKAAMDLFWGSYWTNHETHTMLFTEHNRFIFRWDLDMKQLPMIEPERHLPKASPLFSAASAIVDVMLTQGKPRYDEREDKVGDPITEGAEREGEVGADAEAF